MKNKFQIFPVIAIFIYLLKWEITLMILYVKTDYFVEIHEKNTIKELINHELFIKHLKIIEII
jgi:hypothetical protein